MKFLILLLFIQTLLCLALPVIAYLNTRFLKGTPRRRLAEDDLPFISVCVPARNEEENIGPCVASLLRQDYPRFEVLVLDDCSEDRTSEAATHAGAGDPRFRLIAGKPLPPGWVGKGHACHQMSLAARGDTLFFTDADTIFHPDCLLYCAEVAAAKRADLLTGMPRLVTVGFWERVTVPIIAGVAGSLVYLPLIETTESPLLAGGSGAFLFFRRDTYEAIGGHEAVKDDIVEDLSLTRAVKAAGLKVRLCDGSRYVSCRMYKNFDEVWEGLTKNVFAAFQLNWLLLIPMIAMVLLLSFFPWIWFIFGPGWGWPPLASTILPLLQIASLTLARIMTDRLLSTPDALATLLIPFSSLFSVALALASAIRTLLRKPTPWRGRHYEIFKDKKGEAKKG